MSREKQLSSGKQKSIIELKKIHLSNINTQLEVSQSSKEISQSAVSCLVKKQTMQLVTLSHNQGLEDHQNV